MSIQENEIFTLKNDVRAILHGTWEDTIAVYRHYGILRNGDHEIEKVGTYDPITSEFKYEQYAVWDENGTIITKRQLYPVKKEKRYKISEKKQFVNVLYNPLYTIDDPPCTLDFLDTIFTEPHQ